MWKMQNEIIRLRRGDDSNSINPLPPQGVGAPNLGFRKRTKGTQHIETSLIPNRILRLYVPNVVVMDELVEEQIELEENLEEQEIVLQEDLDASGLEYSSFLFTIDEVFKDGQLLFEDDTCQENVVQTRSQLTKVPLSGPK